MDAQIENPLIDDYQSILGTVKHGKLYRMTVSTVTGTRTGLVRADVQPPMVEITPGTVTFVMEGEPMNANPLYPGKIDKILSLEEVDE